MQEANQPQTTRTARFRDAAAQIRDEGIVDGFKKAAAILDGQVKKDGLGLEDCSRLYGSAYSLAILIQDLTSIDRPTREHAKKQVRELVKLGTEAGK